MSDNILNRVNNIKGHFIEKPKYVPTNAEPDGPLCGNGDIGIANSCSIDSGSLDYYISKNDLWYTDLTVDRSMGNRPGMRSFGVISFGSDILKNCKYEAIQNIIDATIDSKIMCEIAVLEIKCCVLRKANLIVWKLTAKNSDIPIWIRFSEGKRDGDDVEYYRKTTKNRMIVKKNFIEECFEWRLYTQMNITVWGKDRFIFDLKSDETVIITAPFYTNQDSEDYAMLCDQDSININSDKLREYERIHIDWWNNFWKQSGIFIPSELEIEKHWYASHYIMACCCEKGKYAPGLFGNWITSDNPKWGADYHTNYNYEAPWWGCYSSNKVELSEVYDKPLIQYMSKAQYAAREKLGCRGLYLLVGIGPNMLQTANAQTPDGSDDINYWGQKSNAAYTATNMIMRYYYTYDKNYAINIAFPYMREVAKFWEDYLEFVDGRYVVCNVSINENSGGYRGKLELEWLITCEEDDYSSDFNSILTLGLLRALFKCLIDMSNDLNIGLEYQVKWKHILDNLSDFPLQEKNGRTVFRYTERGRNWCDSNSLGIQHIFPSGAIGLSSSKEMLEISTNTLEELSRWEDYNAFPTFFTATARIGYKPSIILAKMNGEIRKNGFPNFFIYFGGGGIECCSAIPSCINEMLLQSHEGVLRFFPVWDKQKDVSFENLRAYGAFLVTASLQNGKIDKIEIMSEKGLLCKIESPWKNDIVVVCDENNVETFLENDYFAFKTEKNKKYTIYPQK